MMVVFVGRVHAFLFLLTALISFSVFPNPNQAHADVILDSPFWRGQLGSLQDRTVVLPGRTAAELNQFIWTDLPATMRGNPYAQLNVITVNAAGTRVEFGTAASLFPFSNSYSAGTNTLRFGDTWMNPSVPGIFNHEARHVVQAYFSHPSMSAANLRSQDIIHQMAREFDAFLPPNAGNTFDALNDMIHMGLYTDGLTYMRDLAPDLTDIQRIGVGLHLSANCRSSIVVGNNLTECAISHYDNALRWVNSADFRLGEDAASASRLLILPRSVEVASEGRLARLLKSVGRSRLMKYIPFVGLAAGLVAAEEARAEGDYVQACVEVGGLFPVIGEGQALGELVVKPIAEATGIIDAVADILTPVAYVIMYQDVPPLDQPLYSNSTLESWRVNAVDWLADRLTWLFTDGDDLKGFNPCGKTPNSTNSHHVLPVGVYKQ